MGSMGFIWVGYYFGAVVILSIAVSLCHCCLQAIFSSDYVDVATDGIKSLLVRARGKETEALQEPRVITALEALQRPRSGVRILLTADSGNVEVLHEGYSAEAAAESQNPPSYEDLLPPSYDVAISL